MKLSEDWLTHGLIDFEYKKYMLLAYMKDTMAHFEKKRLYPFLSELVFHYNNLVQLKENKSLIYENFPKQVSRADFEKLKISYSRIIKDDELMQEIEDVIHFSLPHLKEGLDTGVAIFEEIARHIDIEPIGVTPLFNKEGYLFVCQFNKHETYIYHYRVTTFHASDESYQTLRTEFLETRERNIVNSLERIKIELIQRNPAMPNPATFAAIARLNCPLDETLLPITKRKLVKHIGQAA